MLRFMPDSWVEGLLRPLLLADSAAGIYVEIHAPDWRFAALVLFTALAWIARRSLNWLNAAQLRALLSLVLCFYVWTFVSGNGRYFLWGLLFVGPLVVMMAQRVRATLAMRNFMVLGVLFMQWLCLWMTFEPNVWGLRPWRQGPGIALAPTALRQQPGVFLTIGSISYSVLVPQLHPNSHWANIAGQQDLAPGMREHKRLQQILALPLPTYVVVRATRLIMDEADQPIPQAHGIIARALGRQQLVMTGKGCEFVRAGIAGLPFALPADKPVDNGFWFCPVERGEVPAEPVVEVPAVIEAAFDQVERRCPRFFPPGRARTRPTEEGFHRFYAYSDVALNIDPTGQYVYFKYFRSLNPTILGNAEEVRRGAFTLNCDTLPGRYVPPWARD